MEKQRTKSGSKFSRRLLAAIVFVNFLNPLYAKILTNSDFAKLRFVPVQSNNDTSDFFTNTDIRFEVEVPYVRPGEIDISSPDDMDNVSFKTLKRTELDNENGGTKIEVWYSFSKKGSYNLQPLTVRVQGFKRTIAFAPISVKTNPKDQDPIMIIEFSDGKVATSENGFADISLMEFKVGEKVTFDVLFQYGVQLISFNWNLPKDSIFTQTKEYEILETKYKDKSKLDEIVPVSSFEWIPLMEGPATFPVFSMTITSNNGYKGEIKVPAIQIQVGEKAIENTVRTVELFNQAFEVNEVEHIPEEEVIVTLEDCQELAELRINERYSFFGLKKSKRIEKELSLGLPADSSEFSVSWIYFSILFVVLSLGIFIFFLRKKRLFINIISTALFIFAVIGLSVSILESKKQHGVSCGGQLFSIPDSLSEAKTELKPGSYIEIKEFSGEWIYVLLGESGGWCKKEDIIQIK